MPGSDQAVVIDTPDGIRFAQLCALRGALHLEMKGLRRSRPPSACVIVKRLLRLPARATRETALARLDEEIEKIKEAKRCQ